MGVAITNMQPTLAQRVSFYVIGASLALTTLWHFTLGMHFEGIAIALFFLVLLIAIHGLFIVAKLKPNKWAYLFLAPALCGMLATSLYKVEEVQVRGTLLILVSISLFAYWSTNPLSRWNLVTHLFPWRYFRETLFPFGVSESPIKHVAIKSRWKPVVVGAVIALPVLLVFASLFASADQFFGQSLRNITHHIDEIITIPKLMWDIFLMAMITSIAWLIWTRSRDMRAPIQKERLFRFEPAMIVTVLTLVNILFVIFVAFQGVYFFAGHEYVQAHGLIYSDYMREGFDQLLVAAGFVFGGILLVHRLTRMAPTSIRVLSIALIAETFVILASAAKRLGLYIDAYHLTIDRYWGIISLIFIGLMLAWYLINLARQATFSTQLKQAVVGALYFFGFVLLFNQNAMIASWNLSHREGVIGLDQSYIAYDLMPDAYQVVNESLKAEPGLWTISQERDCFEDNCQSDQDKSHPLTGYLPVGLKEKSPLFLTISELKALQIAGERDIDPTSSK